MKYKVNISHLFLILILIFSVLDVITGYQLVALFELNTLKVSVNSEFWRLFSYPLSYFSIESLALATVAFGIFSPKIEELHKSFMLPIMLLLLAVMHSTIFNWIFMFEDKAMSGSEGLSVFILSFFFLNNPRAKFKLIGLPLLSARNVILGIFTMWSMIIFYKSYNLNDPAAINSAVFGSLGIMNALVLHAQIKIVDRYRAKKIEKEHVFFEEEELTKIERDELSMALIASQQKRFNQKQEKEEVYSISDNAYENEELANQILDKISKSGYDSLNKNELKFLEDYSNNL